MGPLFFCVLLVAFEMSLFAGTALADAGGDNPHSADVAITKSAPSTAVVGDTFVYSITVTNNGPGSAQDAKVSDDLPSGVTLTSATGAPCSGTQSVRCNISRLDAGSSVTITLEVRADATGTVTNTASVAPQGNGYDDPDPSNDASSATTSIGEPPPGPLDHITISPSYSSITARGSQTYSAEGFDSRGNDLGDVTPSTSFQISPDGSCTGSTCTAATSGSHTVTGDDSGKTATATLDVAAGALDHITIAPKTASVAAGDSEMYTAQGFDSSGNSLGDVTSSTVFSIADGSCSGANCSATSAGDHGVTGTNSGHTDTATLTVTAGPLDHITIAPSTSQVTAGDSQAYTARGYDAYGNDLGDVTPATTFQIDPDGSCSAATCTATIAGAHSVTGTDAGKTATASLTVLAGDVDHIAISPASAESVAGRSQAYTAEGFDRYGNSVGDVTPATTFVITPDGTCVGASCSATVAGAHTVTGDDGGKTATAALQVLAGALDHITISPKTSSVPAGQSVTYSAQGFDAYENSLGDVTSATAFSILPDGSCSDASCTATVAGSHTVTGDDDGKTDTATLGIGPSTLDRIVMSPKRAQVAAGDSQVYSAEGFDRYGNTLGNVTGGTTFGIAPNGTCAAASCTATVAGPHTVTANNSGKTDTSSLAVVAAALDHISISPGTASITAGGTTSYTAEAFDSYGNSRGDVTATTIFTITPDGSCTGATCGAQLAGPHTVTGANAGKTATATLSVAAGPLDHIAISPDTATIVAGGTLTYTTRGYDANGNDLGDKTSATVFSIAPNGTCEGALCSATTAGAHSVTGAFGGKTATSSLQVNPGALDHIVLSPASATINAGGTQAYTAAAFDAFNNALGAVTNSTAFTITPDGSCTGAVCSASVSGPHVVTGTHSGKIGTATLTVSALPTSTGGGTPPTTGGSSPPTQTTVTPPAPATIAGTPTTQSPAALRPAVPQVPSQPLNACRTAARPSGGAAAAVPFVIMPAAISLEEEFKRRRGGTFGEEPYETHSRPRRRPRSLKLIVGAVVLVVLAALAPLFLRHSGPARNATLAVTAGTADVAKQHDGFIPATTGTKLSTGDVVRTGPASRARIDYPDGSLTRLDENTTFEVRDVRVSAAQKSIKLQLDKGRVWNRVSKLTHPGDRYEVKTVTAVATVRGTIFVDDCRFTGTCTLLVMRGLVGDTTNAGIAESVAAGNCRTDDGKLIGPCAATYDQIIKDPFLLENAKLDGLDLRQIFKNMAAAKAAAAAPAPKTTANGCQRTSGQSSRSGSPTAMIVGLTTMIFFGLGRRRRAGRSR